MSGIGVVFNPKSGKNVRDPLAAARLARRLGDHGVVRTARSLDELHRIAEDFRRVDIDVLAISGGDGTNHVTLSGFLDVYAGATIPRVALLRGGTMNTVANSVGVRKDRPEGLLSRLLVAYVHRAANPIRDVERHVMRIAEDSGPRHHYGFLFGTGVTHGFLSEYYRAGAPTTLIAAKTLAHAICSAIVGGETIRRMAAPFRGSVELDDGTTWPERDYLTVAAGTIPHIGLSFRPFHRFAEKPGAFHALAVHSTPMGLVRELPRIHKGQPMRPERAFDAISSRMRVLAASGPLRYMIDGDLHECRTEITVSTGPLVRLLVIR